MHFSTLEVQLQKIEKYFPTFSGYRLKIQIFKSFQTLYLGNDLKVAKKFKFSYHVPKKAEMCSELLIRVDYAQYYDALVSIVYFTGNFFIQKTNM